MPFQQVVNRAYTTGFVGEFVRIGPKRVRVGRIIANVQNAPNRIGRAVGYVSDLSVVGSAGSHTLAADSDAFRVGDPIFAGLMIHPKHYALSGVAGDSLAPSLNLPNGSEVEVAYMATGLVVELVNHTTAEIDAKFGWALAYVSSATTAVQNPVGLDIGTLIVYDPSGAVPDGYVAIPNSRITNAVTIGASAVGAIIGATTIVDLTQ
ncbi:hypothetical protein CNR33_00037 [Pseudomonas phage tabernarius]|uniref:Virion structural protein n=1 Tax=Pseudomonas phage tabernarius TaxID=2048978 RepID=A0A2H4P6S1_9CAUD|nr:virion structural protein [Pseudomonas phage tabernarius]ATW57883.1 hypothetical protein CNR33_00037 [Pseudomonas phage tabernarius]